MFKSISIANNIVKIQDRLDFSVHQEFNAQVAKALEQMNSEVVVDFSQTTYMDSAALGMLQEAQEHARQRNKTIVLQSPHHEVAKTLEAAHFNRMFVIRT